MGRFKMARWWTPERPSGRRLRQLAVSERSPSERAAVAGTWIGGLGLVLVVAGAAGACSENTEGHDDGEGTGGNLNVVVCEPGQFTCAGDVAQACDGKGGIVDTRDCAEEGLRCVAPLGCVTCLPGEQGRCEDGVGRYCSDDGAGFTEFDCDPVQGLECQPEGCVGACALPELQDTYLGCDYYPTVTLNPVWSGFDFAVAVANAGQQAAAVVITRAGTEVAEGSVPSGDLRVFSLPWVPELKGDDVDACQTPPDPGATRVVRNGAYRLRTDQPVTVFQLSPLQYELDGDAATGCPVKAECPGAPEEYDCYSYSNDASLLLPATALTGSYVAVSWPSTSSRAGTVAITATEDGTEVQVDGVGDFTAGAGVSASGAGTVSLDRGDVLELVAAHDVPAGQYGADLSGTRVLASAPVQVIAGHSCANIPTATTDACDHIEQAMPPVETLGTDYFVLVPPDEPRETVIRLAAVNEGAEVSIDPPPSGIDVPLHLDAGDPPREIAGITSALHITSDEEILVTQYMLGAGHVGWQYGDPSMSVVVPTAQYRDEYVFVASSTYDQSFINIIARSDASVTVDDEQIPASEWEPVGDSGYSMVRWPLLRDVEVHRASGSASFGIQVHGYGQYTSYMYPGGLDLEKIAQPLIR